MNVVLSFVLATLVYPGIIVALVAAWALAWARSAARAALHAEPLPGPLSEVSALRSLFQRDTYSPEGVQPAALALGTTLAVVSPLLALILLPVPGNPLVGAIGLSGDLVAEGALLLGLPLARLFVGWAIPSPYTRLAADRDARLLAGAALPFVLALTASAQVINTLALTSATSKPAANPFVLLTLALGAAAYACALPVLARVTPLREHEGEIELLGGELSELSGRDLACFRIGEILQFVAVAALFVVAFVLPLLSRFTTELAHGVILIVALALTAVGVGVWEGFHSRRTASEERPPLSWWLGIPLLLGLAALVAAAWATRGV